MILPAAAPQIQLIECVRIEYTEDSHLWSRVPGTTIGIWEDADVTTIIDLVTALPDDEVMRCFIPRYGIRAHGPDGLLFEIAFCFRCHGAKIFTPDPEKRGDLIGFDATSPPAQTLLTKFRAL